MFLVIQAFVGIGLTLVLILQWYKEERGERNRKVQLVLNSFKSCFLSTYILQNTYYYVFWEYGRCLKNMPFCHKCWMIILFTIMSKMKSTWQRYMLQISSFISYGNSLFAETDNGFYILRKTNSSIFFIVIYNVWSMDSTHY